nr:MAG TPA: hypothetical protein [Caudoviricetes sp.]
MCKIIFSQICFFLSLRPLFRRSFAIFAEK